MIVTVTPNPSLDLTYTLPSAPQHGDVDVERADSSTVEASGKGVNVSRALTHAGIATHAVLPAGGMTGRYLVELLASVEVPHHVSVQRADTRVNTTVLRPGGVTIKINGPGGTMDAAEVDRLCNATQEVLRGIDERHGDPVWVAVCGSLPPDVGVSLIVELISIAHAQGARCAVDASGAALHAAIEGGADLLAPNRRELCEIRAGLPRAGRLTEFADAAQELSAQAGVQLLVSLGNEGAVFTDGVQVLHGGGPPLDVVNTAGAGDALLAGWLSGEGLTAPQRLHRALRWGRSACLSTTTVDPAPGCGDSAPLTVRDLTTDDGRR